MHAVQEIVAPWPGSRTMGEVIDRALRLVHHTTKLVGGAELDEDAPQRRTAAPARLSVPTSAEPLSTLAGAGLTLRAR